MNQKALLFFVVLVFALNANATFTTYLNTSTYNSCSIYWDENKLSNAMAYIPDHNIVGTGNYDLNFNFTISADITGDGIDDLVFYRDYSDPESSPSHYNDFRVSYIPNTGTNANPIFNFGNKNDISNIAYQGVRNGFITMAEMRPAVCDYDQDGKNDIFGYVYVYCNPNATGVKIGYWHNDGGGTFSYQGYLTAIGAYQGTYYVCSSPTLDNVIPPDTSSIACADLDGDNYPELLISGIRQNNELPANLQDGVNIFKNNGGNITTASYVQTLAPFGTGAWGGDWSFSSFGLFDANNNGKLDIGVKKSKWIQSTNSQRWTQFYRNNSTIGNFSFAPESFGGGYSTFGPLTPTKLYGGQVLDLNAVNTGSTYPWPIIGFAEWDQNSANYNVKRDGTLIGNIVSKAYTDSLNLSSATSYTYSVDAYKGTQFMEGSTNLVCTTGPFPFTVEGISNLGSYYFDSLHLIPANETLDLIVKITNVYPSATDLNIFIENSLKDGRQYFIYTSTNGIDWVFNDSLTNGTTDSNPIQKIWDENKGVYQYQFQESFLPSEIKYYKFTYRLPSRYYETVKNSSGWWNQYEPEQQDINGLTRDVWTVTYYSNIFSKNLDATAIITVGGLVTSAQSYELQFNAYKTTTDVVNVVIERYNDHNNAETVISTIPLTTIDHRYSIPITLYDINEYVVIKTNAQTFSSNVIFSDYALIEVNYFRDRMILLKENYEPLDVWIDVNSNSHQYIDEGQPFRFQTTIYDRDGKILTETIRVYAYGTNDANRVYQANHNILEPIEENIRTLSEAINGIVLIKEGRITGVSTPIKVTVTICDATQCLAEQSQWLRLHNYPFFPTDFFLQNQETARTLNTGPKGRFFIQSRLPDTVSALRVRIYLGQFMCPPDQTGQTIDGVLCTGQRAAVDSNKVFEKYFYRGRDFNCTTSEDCSFDYDLGNEFHYFYEFPFTTFTNLQFNTTDSNDFWSRTLYTIGKQPLTIWAELQGIPDTQSTNSTCYPSIVGTSLKLDASTGSLYSTVTDLRTALMGNAGYIYYIYYSKTWTMNDHINFTRDVFNNGGDIPSQWQNSVMGKIADSSSCEKVGSHSQAYKVVAKVLTTDGSDIHQYLSANFYLTKINLVGGTLKTFTNKFYPIQTYFDNFDNTGINTIIWNTNLFDENGDSIQNGSRYKFNLSFTDSSLRNTDGTATLNLTVDDANATDSNAYFKPLQSLFYIPNDKGIQIQGAILTNGLQIDQIEGQLITKFSGYDTIKTDMENQIGTFKIGLEDIVKLREDSAFNFTNDWNKFQAENPAAVMGACISENDILFNVDSVFSDDKNRVIENVIFGMAGWIQENILGNFTTTTVKGCGNGKYINSIFKVANTLDSPLDKRIAMRQELATSFYKFDGQKYKTMNIKITGVPNNYDELKALGGFSDINTSPQTIINDLAKKGIKPIEAPIIVEFTDLGKRFVLPNYLVSTGTLKENVDNREYGLKLIYKTNNFQNKQAVVYDFAGMRINPQSQDFWVGLNNNIFNIVANYAMIIFAFVVLIVLIYIMARISPRGGA